MADIIIVNGGYKPTYNWGAPPWMWPIFNHHHRQGPRIYWTAAPKKRCGLDELMSCGILECLTGLTFRSFRQPGPGMTWLSASESCQAAYAMPPLLCGWFMPLCGVVLSLVHYWPLLAITDRSLGHYRNRWHGLTTYRIPLHHVDPSGPRSCTSWVDPLSHYGFVQKDPEIRWPVKSRSKGSV